MLGGMLLFLVIEQELVAGINKARLLTILPEEASSVQQVIEAYCWPLFRAMEPKFRVESRCLCIRTETRLTRLKIWTFTEWSICVECDPFLNLRRPRCLLSQVKKPVFPLAQIWLQPDRMTIFFDSVRIFFLPLNSVSGSWIARIKSRSVFSKLHFEDLELRR